MFFDHEEYDIDLCHGFLRLCPILFAKKHLTQNYQPTSNMVVNFFWNTTIYNRY